MYGTWYILYQEKGDIMCSVYLNCTFLYIPWEYVNFSWDISNIWQEKQILAFVTVGFEPFKISRYFTAFPKFCLMLGCWSLHLLQSAAGRSLAKDTYARAVSASITEFKWNYLDFCCWRFLAFYICWIFDHSQTLVANFSLIF